MPGFFVSLGEWSSQPALAEDKENYVACKRPTPWGLQPCVHCAPWPTADLWQYVRSQPRVFRVVRRLPKGSELFTTPIPAHRGGGAQEL